VAMQEPDGFAGALGADFAVARACDVFGAAMVDGMLVCGAGGVTEVGALVRVAADRLANGRDVGDGCPVGLLVRVAGILGVAAEEVTCDDPGRPVATAEVPATATVGVPGSCRPPVEAHTAPAITRIAATSTAGSMSRTRILLRQMKARLPPGGHEKNARTSSGRRAIRCRIHARECPDLLAERPGFATLDAFLASRAALGRLSGWRMPPCLAARFGRGRWRALGWRRVRRTQSVS
jgi:hypothetical protein